MDIYPAIDIKGGHCVRLSQGQFDSVTTYSDDPVKVAKKWVSQGARWLHVVDLDGARKGMPDTRNLDVLRQILRQAGVPVQFGGGVRSAEVVERMLRLGVTRVVVGTAAARDEALARSLLTLYPEQVAVGVDARDGFVAVEGWFQKIDESAPAFVRRMAALGACRFIFTDISKDGMLQGVNVKAVGEIAASAPDARLIASGGVSGPQDVDALVQLAATTAPNLDGIIIGKALYAGAIYLQDAISRAGG